MTPSRSWKDVVRAILPWKVYWKLKRIREEYLTWPRDNSLTDLAKIYKTDKWGHHFYTSVYEQWFAPLRNKPVTLLEIGVGGYEEPRLGGDSLRMWKKYFHQGNIIGIDLHDKSSLQENRIKIYKGDQSDPEFLKNIVLKEGPFDIIIDDGSHMQSHIITSFENLFPYVNTGGIYVIEDTQTSYWPRFEGSTSEMQHVPSAMNYFIQRVHTVNRNEWLKEESSPDIPDQGIGSIAFYHNLIIVMRS